MSIHFDYFTFMCMSSKSTPQKSELEKRNSVCFLLWPGFLYLTITVEESLRNLLTVAVIFKKIILTGNWKTNAWRRKSSFHQIISPTTKHLATKVGRGVPSHPRLSFLASHHCPSAEFPPCTKALATWPGLGAWRRAPFHALGIRCGRLLSNKQPIERAARSLLGLFKLRLKPLFKRLSNYNGQRLAIAKLPLLIK